MVWLGLESWSTRWSILRLGYVRSGHPSHWAGGENHGLTWVRVIVHTVKLFPQNHHMWSILRLSYGTRPTGQAVRVMVWLGLESWSTRLNCSLGVITRGVSLGEVRAHVPLGRRLEVLVRVMVHTVKMFPWSHHLWSILRLG